MQSVRKDRIVRTSQSGTLFFRKLSRSCKWLTVLKALEMSSDRTNAICFLELQMVCICSMSNSRAVSVDLFFLFPICVSGSSWCCSASSLSLQAITASRTFPKVLSNAIRR